MSVIYVHVRTCLLRTSCTCTFVTYCMLTSQGHHTLRLYMRAVVYIKFGFFIYSWYIMVFQRFRYALVGRVLLKNFCFDQKLPPQGNSKYSPYEELLNMLAEVEAIINNRLILFYIRNVYLMISLNYFLVSFQYCI